MMEKDMEWASKHTKELKRYSGKWIAVKAGKGVIASGNSVEEVMGVVKKKGIEEPLVTKIPRKDEEAYILFLG